MRVVTCPRCGYSWRPRRTRRTSKYTCSNCGYTFYMYVTPSPTPPPSTTPTTPTPPPTPTPGTTQFHGGDIKVRVKDLPGEAYDELRKIAEEVSTPDSSGVEVLILDADVAERILRAYGVGLEDQC